VVHSFGAPTKAIACSGGKSGKRFEELLRGAGFAVHVVKIRNEIRNNITIVDKQGLAVKLNETGPHIQIPELRKVEKALRDNLSGAAWLMLCGSLPPGVPTDFYARLIRLAHKVGVKTLLDTDGDALLHGLEAGPTAVAPNQAEAERLLNRALITKAHFFEAVSRIVAMGAQSAVLSLGSRGAVAANGGALYEGIPPVIDAVCPIGAGDALAATFIWALRQGKKFEDAIRWGVACGTASAALPGISFPTRAQTAKMYERVQVRELKA
jgi:1-phosphofructokinase family hexose kinase